MVRNWFYSFFFFFKQKTAYEIVDCDWSSDVCSSDLHREAGDILSALKANSRALRYVRKTEPSTLTISILRTRSSTYVLLGQIGRASCRERV